MSHLEVRHAVSEQPPAVETFTHFSLSNSFIFPCGLPSSSSSGFLPAVHSKRLESLSFGHFRHGGTFTCHMSSHFFTNRKSGELIILEALHKQGCKCVFQGQGGLSCLVSHKLKSAPAHCYMTVHGHKDECLGVTFAG